MAVWAIETNLHLFDQILLNGALLSKDKQFHSLGFFRSAVSIPTICTFKKEGTKATPFAVLPTEILRAVIATTFQFM